MSASDDAIELFAWNAPGMPPPGVDFLELASLDDPEIAAWLADPKKKKSKGKKASNQLQFSDVLLSTRLAELHEAALFADGFSFKFPTTLRPGNKVLLDVVSGQAWASPGCTGPQGQHDVMLIGKCLGEEEVKSRKAFCGNAAGLLSDTLRGLGLSVTDYCNWYVTPLIKTRHPDRDKALKKPWIDNWLPILHQELRIVRPKFILCMGSDAVQALVGKHANLKWMEGRVVDFTFPLAREWRNGKPDTDEVHTAKLMSVVHPAFVLSSPEQMHRFTPVVEKFVNLIRGRVISEDEDKGLDHRVIDSLEGVLALEREIAETCEDNLIAIDAEWHGKHPQNIGSYLRCVQISWRHKTAACISFTKPGGKRRFKGSIVAAVEALQRICRGRQIAGHFFTADLEFLIPFGLDLLQDFSVPKTWQEYREAALSGQPCGFDTGLALHAIEETADFSLKAAASRFTSAPRYDLALMDWLKDFCAENKLKDEEVEGFGEAPDAILEPYALYDADVTRRLAVLFKQRLCRDDFGNDCWEPFWINMRAVPAVLEINTTGLLVDRKRIDELTQAYMCAKTSLEEEIRTWSRWPEFNVNSVFDVREFLYGERLNGTKQIHGEVRRKRPKGAISLRLEPQLTTDKRPMPWAEVVSNGLEDEKTPGTDKTSLALLAQESQEVVLRRADGTSVTRDLSKYVLQVRDARFIGQILKSVLRPPDVDEATGEIVTTEQNNWQYSSGLPSAICSDGRIRTHIYPTKETGRWSSARPPLQNISKRREKDYKRILGKQYKYPIRSMFIADPGRLLIEADYIGAELFGMAILSGDATMLEHVRRNQLPEGHPDYFDIHSNIARLAFKLDCAPSKAGLESLGKSNLRIVAKSIIFGCAYGRGAKAVSIAVKEEGTEITIDQAQQVIDTIFKTYPGLRALFSACQLRAIDPRWLCGCFGRYRRFPLTNDKKAEGDFMRSGMNFPIQGLIADAVARAVDNLVEYRVGRSIDYKIVLQIHDAVILSVAIPDVGEVVDRVFPECMIQGVPIYPRTLAGVPTGTGPYYLGTDTNIYTCWGEQMSPEECQSLGVDPKYAHWHESPDGEGWVHPEKSGQKWVSGAWKKL